LANHRVKKRVSAPSQLVRIEKLDQRKMTFPGTKGGGRAQVDFQKQEKGSCAEPEKGKFLFVLWKEKGNCAGRGLRGSVSSG